MAENILQKKISIGGKQVPVWVLAVGGGGALVLYFVTKQGGTQAASTDSAQSLADQAAQLATQTGQASTTTGASQADLQSLSDQLTKSLSAFETGFTGQVATQQATEQAQNQSALAAFQKQITDFLNQKSAPVATTINGPVTNPAAPVNSAAPAYTPTPEVQAVAGMTSGASPVASIFSQPVAQVKAMAVTAPAAANKPANIYGATTTTPASGAETTAKVSSAEKKSLDLGPSPSASPAVGPSVSSYTIKSGDTLSAIAKAYGITLSKLESSNPQISNFNLIYPNQKINIPT